MAAPTLIVQPRKVLGRKVKKLRREGVLPANIYGRKVKSKAVQLDLAAFEKVFDNVGETGLVKLTLDKKTSPVLIHNIQLDPVTDIPIHTDFLRVDLKEKVTVHVPVELSGESPAEKEGRGTVVQYIDEIEVEALPGNLPDKFEIDSSALTEVDQQVHVKDLAVDKKKVEVKQDSQQVIVKVEPPRKEEEVAPPPEEVPEEEAPKEEAAPPEEAPKEGEEKTKAEEPAVEVPATETKKAKKKGKLSKT